MKRRCGLAHIRAGLPGVPHKHLTPIPWSFLPCPVPEKYQLNQGVCEMHQPILGYADDPKPVVQYVQVHVVGLCARGSEEKHAFPSCALSFKC